MSKVLRVASLNLRAYFTRKGHIKSMIELLAQHDCDVVLLQECRKRWFHCICNATGMTGAHAHLLPRPSPPGFFPPDGCAILVREPIDVRRYWRILPGDFMPDVVHRAIYETPPCNVPTMSEKLARRYSGRTLLAEATWDDRTVVFASFHATPGTGRCDGAPVDELKPFFHGAVAAELARLNSPFVFAIDANEPEAESLDGIKFHWADGRFGNKKLRRYSD